MVLNVDVETKSESVRTATVPQTVEGAEGMSATKSYGQILKSSALIGSSSVLKIGLGVVRTKAMALLLGPSGIGLLGLYGSIADLAQSVASMGLNSSGVRQIAESVGTGDSQRIARTVTTLRRLALYLGVLGALLLLILSKPVSRLTFGDDQHVIDVALLSLAVFLGAVSAAQVALVQGMRRIADLAVLNVLGAFFGTLFSIVIVYIYYRHGVAEQGVVPVLICVAGMAILTSWWYARKIKVEPVKMSLAQVALETSGLLKLGLVFMVTGLMTQGSAYVVRIIVLRRIGIDAAGYYQAAWALGGVYVGFILQAMGADFYPRLTAVANDNAECNRLVNEQAEVGLLMAGPGVLATLSLAPLVIQIFYSSKFGPTVEVLRWICLGMMLRVAIWPMGFILLAKGEGMIFFWTEFMGNVLLVGLAWFGVQMFDLRGAGIAFFGLYVVYGCAMYVVVRWLSGFRWSTANARIGPLLYLSVAVVFVSWYFLPHMASVLLGIGVTVVAGIYSLKTVCTLIPVERFPQFMQRALALLKLIPTNTHD